MLEIIWLLVLLVVGSLSLHVERWFRILELVKGLSRSIPLYEHNQEVLSTFVGVGEKRRKLLFAFPTSPLRLSFSVT